jgi:hypothetical protein
MVAVWAAACLLTDAELLIFQNIGRQILSPCCRRTTLNRGNGEPTNENKLEKEMPRLAISVM